MATHKVPQDVEADDKLIGFLSMKQFIFTVLGLGFGYMTFFFATKVHPIASIIWVPFTLIFLVLGLYQRKDQPAEVYLASAIRFRLKPRKRKWDQEGYVERVHITAPPVIEKHYTKDFTGEEAYSRLGNLSRLMDSRGWTSKLGGDWQNPQLAVAAASDRIVSMGAMGQGPGINPQDYGQPVDVMDEQTSLVAKQFESKIQEVDATTHQQAIQNLQQARQTAQASTPSTATPTYKKYPEIHQKVIAPPAASMEPVKNSAEPAVPKQDTTAAPTEPKVVKQTPKQSAVPKQYIADDGSVEISLH